LNSEQPVDLLNSVIYCQYSIGLLWAWWAAKNLVRTIKVQQKIRHRKNSIAEKISDNLSDNQHFHFKVFFFSYNNYCALSVLYFNYESIRSS